jgi:hypothetical protein
MDSEAEMCPGDSAGAAAAVGDGSDPENPLRQKVADAFKQLLDLPDLDAGLPRRRSSRRRAQGKK